MDGGLETKETQGLFNIIYPEGVSFFRGRLISIRRLKTLRGESSAAGRPEWSSHGGAMDRIAGVLGSFAPEHQSRKQNHQAVEKLTTNPPKRLVRTERGQGRLTATESAPKLGEIRSELQQRLGLGLDE